jgi:hypothetical protein
LLRIEQCSAQLPLELIAVQLSAAEGPDALFGDA